MKQMRRVSVVVTIALCSAIVLLIGGFGFGRYIDTFWLYRGFAAPAHAKFIIVGSGSHRQRIPVYPGTLSTVSVKSAALGERRVSVIIYLPPNYNQDISVHYPVLFLLHGFPGSPAQFVNVGDIAETSNILLAEHRIRPMIVVMPSGSWNFFSGNEWANSIRPNNAWETFVTRDLVQTINHRYRTINRGSSRGIGGLSEGGYGALNLAFHHVGEFHLIESWSAFYIADRSPTLFGDNTKLLAYNSPALEVTRVASRLRADHVYIWLYSGRRDISTPVSRRFAAELASLRVAHRYTIPHGHHNWGLWRSMMPASLVTASEFFYRGLAHS